MSTHAPGFLDVQMPVRHSAAVVVGSVCRCDVAVQRTLRCCAVLARGCSGGTRCVLCFAAWPADVPWWSDPVAEAAAAGVGDGRSRAGVEAGAAVVVAWRAVPAPRQPWLRTTITTAWCRPSWSTSGPRGVSRSRPSRRMTCPTSHRVSNANRSIGVTV